MEGVECGWRVEGEGQGMEGKGWRLRGGVCGMGVQSGGGLGVRGKGWMVRGRGWRLEGGGWG